jgi:hypothetical protein
MIGLMIVLVLGTLATFGDAQERTTAKIPIDARERLSASQSTSAPVAQKVHLDAKSPTYLYHLMPPRDGEYTAVVKEVANVPLKVDVAIAGARPGVRTETIALAKRTEHGVDFAAFRAKKGIRYDVTVSTATAIPKNAKTQVDTVFTMLAGTGRKAHTIVAERPIEEFLPPSNQKDPFVPILVRLMERHLANARDKNEMDRAFDSVLKRNPTMTQERMATFVKNYNAIPEQVRRNHFIEPTPGRAATAAMTKDDVKKAVTTAHPDLAKVELHKKVLVSAELQKGLKNRPVVNEKIQQLQAIVVPVVGFSLAPWLDRFDPAPPANGYSPGDALTIIGKNFSTKASDNQIWLSKPNTGPDGGINQQQATPDSATPTQLKFHVPNLYKGIWTVHVKTPNGVSTNKDLQLPVQEIPPAQVQPPSIRDVIPPNMEPGTLITIRTDASGPAMAKDPLVTMLATGPQPIKGQFVFLTAKSLSATECQVQLPADMTAGIYDVAVAGDYKGISTIMSAPYPYTVQPGRYQIQFEQMICVKPCHYSLGTSFGNIGWDLDANLVTMWAADVDDAWWTKSAANNKYNDVGGGHPPVGYAGSDGNVFTVIPGDVEGYVSVRYGLVLVTQLYDWEDGTDAKQLADEVKTYGETAGAVVSMVYAPAGAVITAIADKVAMIIPLIAKLLGLSDTVAFSTFSGTPVQYSATPGPYEGPDKHKWTASQLQQMAPGEWRPGPPGTPGYTMKFGQGAFNDWVQTVLYSGSITVDLSRQGDWRLTWRIRRAVAGGNVTAP